MTIGELILRLSRANIKEAIQLRSANARRSSNAGSMLGQCRRRRTSIEPALVERLALAGKDTPKRYCHRAVDTMDSPPRGGRRVKSTICSRSCQSHFHFKLLRRWLSKLCEIFRTWIYSISFLFLLDADCDNRSLFASMVVVYFHLFLLWVGGWVRG